MCLGEQEKDLRLLQKQIKNLAKERSLRQKKTRATPTNSLNSGECRKLCCR